MTQLDLNLLRLLVALEQTRHLGRAAQSLGMSQSGFSTALARLRKQLGDDLFVRSAGGMRPTPRALALAETARSVLQQVQVDVLGSSAFDPRQSDVGFRLCMTDVGEAVFLPVLVGHLSVKAPNCTLQISPPDGTPLHERLAAGALDLAIGYFPDLERDAYFRQPLFSHTYACIVRKGHPVTAEGMTRSGYERWGHAVVVSPSRSTSLLDRAIERERLKRRVVVSTSNHLSLPKTIAGSDLIATVPLRTAVDAAKTEELVVLGVPFRPPTFPIHQYWHRRTHGEPGYQWLRGQVKALFGRDNDPYAEQGRALYGAAVPSKRASSRRKP